MTDLLAKLMYSISKVILGFVFIIFTLLAFLLLFSFVEVYSYADLPFLEIINQLNLDENSYHKPTIHISIPLVNGGIQLPWDPYVFCLIFLFLLFYTTYFYSLHQFFKLFTIEKIFNKKSINKLKLFSYLNLVPLAYWFIFAIYYSFKGNFHFDDDFIILFFYLGIFIFVQLIVRAFKKGTTIQEENELTI